MRIAVMWRHLQEQGGIALYTRRIVQHLLEIDQRNEYLLLVPPDGAVDVQAPNARMVRIFSSAKASEDTTRSG